MTLKITGVLVFVSLLLATPAQADKCPGTQTDESASKVKADFKTQIVDGHKTIIVKKPVIVCAVAPRPNVLYVVQATSLNYRWDRLKQDFLPKIRTAVQQAPF